MIISVLGGWDEQTALSLLLHPTYIYFVAIRDEIASDGLILKEFDSLVPQLNWLLFSFHTFKSWYDIS